jgi:hypothetical protein
MYAPQSLVQVISVNWEDGQYKSSWADLVQDDSATVGLEFAALILLLGLMVELENCLPESPGRFGDSPPRYALQTNPIPEVTASQENPWSERCKLA